MITKLVTHYEYLFRNEARYEARNAPVNCLNNPTTSAACGRLTPGRTTTSADWCARSDDYAAGTLKLHETLVGSEIDVIIIPAADDTEWLEGRAPSWSSNLARSRPRLR